MKLRKQFNNIVENIYEELYKVERKNPIAVLFYRPAIMFLIAVSEIIFSIVEISRKVIKWVIKWVIKS